MILIVSGIKNKVTADHFSTFTILTTVKTITFLNDIKSGEEHLGFDLGL